MVELSTGELLSLSMIENVHKKRAHDKGSRFANVMIPFDIPNWLSLGWGFGYGVWTGTVLNCVTNVYYPVPYFKGRERGSAEIYPRAKENECPCQYHEQGQVTRESIHHDQTQGHEQEEEEILQRQTDFFEEFAVEKAQNEKINIDF
ncbi:hypothetical protein MAR_023823 [Mya arenaria]|uniref:Uncharacterized protein n=1 Tax=Mya arenaria TaxID=6604 RepID=A0ABY7DRZ7_MYAAR|nr:hypothetical protein MAR_023823 [Mya arenaria]